ncbi:hypothetical protein ACWCOP_00625 [Maricaulaceae bacterium MS644]
MTAMVQDFDGVRELSMAEVDAVAGGPVWALVALGATAAWVGSTYGESFLDGFAEGITGQEPTKAD